jgi:hypothetical protein
MLKEGHIALVTIITRSRIQPWEIDLQAHLGRVAPLRASSPEDLAELDQRET